MLIMNYEDFIGTSPPYIHLGLCDLNVTQTGHDDSVGRNVTYRVLYTLTILYPNIKKHCTPVNCHRYAYI